MILRYLKLENYRSYASAEIEFPSGLTALVGPNGAGKSTLLESVTWALFGKSRTDKEGIRSDFAPDKAPCRVEVAFEIQGTTWRVVRELRGKALTVHARMTREGVEAPLAEGASAVEEHVQKLLGMDSATFFASVFSRQKQVDALTEISAGKREEAFRRMLGLDSLDEVVVRIRSDARTLASELKGLQEKRRDPAKLKEDKDRARRLLDDLKPKIEKSRHAVKAAEDAEAASQKEFNRLRALERQHAGLDKEKGRLEEGSSRLAMARERLETDLREVQAARGRLEKIRPLLHELERVRERLGQLDPLQAKHHERENLRDQKKRTLAQLEGDREELAKLVKLLEPLEDVRRNEEKLEKSVDLARKALRAAQTLAARGAADVENRQQKVSEIDARVAKLKKLGGQGKCPFCLQKLGESYEEALAHIARERDAAAAAIKEAREAAKGSAAEEALKEKELEALDRAHREEKKRLDELLKIETRREAQDRTVRRAVSDLARMDKALEALADLKFDPAEHDRLKKREKELTPQEKESGRLEQSAGRIPDLEKKLGEAAAEIKESVRRTHELNGQIAALGFDPKQMKKADEELDRARKACTERREERTRIEKDILSGEKDLEKAEEAIAEEKRLGRLAADKERRKAELAVLEEVFGAFRQHLTDRIRPTLASRAGALLSGITGGRYSQVELDDDYNVRVLDGGEMRPLKRFSGGETDLINLCLRIAISRIVAGRGAGRVNLLVLDEVFGSQDSHRKDNVLQGLRSLTGEFQQVFVITHDEYLKDRMESVLAISRADGVRSALTRDN
jgi:exonuclease SbcC